jgi:YHS domain-containing protein
VQDPGNYLNQLDIALNCAVDPGAAAVLDSAHCIFINWEAYFVSTAEAKAAFEKEPYRYTGAVTDPVSRTRFQPDETSPRREYEGRVFYFSSGRNLTEFASNPSTYATPMLGMIEKPE